MLAYDAGEMFSDRLLDQGRLGGVAVSKRSLVGKIEIRTNSPPMDHERSSVSTGPSLVRKETKSAGRLLLCTR
jgi:hypothetical protein